MATVFKTASFRVYNPTRKKAARLKYAMEIYHRTFVDVLNKCLDDPDFKQRCQRVTVTRSGREKITFPDLQIAKEVRRKFVAPKWPCAPIRDYLIADISAALGSFYAVRQDSSAVVSPPTIPSLEPKPWEDVEHDLQALVESLDSSSFQLSAAAQQEITALQESGAPRKAERRKRALINREASKLAGRTLAQIDGALPRPIQFEHSEPERGFLILKKGTRFMIGLRLFGEHSSYFEKKDLSGLLDWKTQTLLTQHRPFILLPVEFSRNFHEHEYLAHGKPKSAKLIMRRNDHGQLHFFINVAFEFEAPDVQPETIIGVDRGWSKIASCTLIDKTRRVIQTGIDLEGQGFMQLQRDFERRIARDQKLGKKIRSSRFRVRGRASDNALGEFANRLVALAVQHKAQIVIEKLNATAMSRFLRRSQIAKLKTILDYKTLRAGLPKPLEVSAAFSSQTCVGCGHKHPGNRPKKDAQGLTIQHVFKCLNCGYEANADHNASHFLALRGLHRLESMAANHRRYAFEDFIAWLVGSG